MSEAEIKSGLLSIEPQHPFVQALNALMENAVGDEQDAVTNPNLTDGARHFNAGRLAHAKDFRGAIAGIIDEAKREQAEALAKAERGKGE
jgi:hypothetical protein